MKKAVFGIAVAAASAWASYGGEVSRANEWQDVAPDTLIGTVVDLADKPGWVASTNIAVSSASNIVTKAYVEGLGIEAGVSPVGVTNISTFVAGSMTNDLVSKTEILSFSPFSKGDLYSFSLVQMPYTWQAVLNAKPGSGAIPEFEIIEGANPVPDEFIFPDCGTTVSRRFGNKYGLAYEATTLSGYGILNAYTKDEVSSVAYSTSTNVVTNVVTKAYVEGLGVSGGVTTNDVRALADEQIEAASSASGNVASKEYVQTTYGDAQSQIDSLNMQMSGKADLSYVSATYYPKSGGPLTGRASWASGDYFGGEIGMGGEDNNTFMLIAKGIKEVEGYPVQYTATLALPNSSGTLALASDIPSPYTDGQAGVVATNSIAAMANKTPAQIASDPLCTTSALSAYLPLTGGTVKGDVLFADYEEGRSPTITIGLGEARADNDVVLSTEYIKFRRVGYYDNLLFTISPNGADPFISRTWYDGEEEYDYSYYLPNASGTLALSSDLSPITNSVVSISNTVYNSETYFNVSEDGELSLVTTNGVIFSSEYELTNKVAEIQSVTNTLSVYSGQTASYTVNTDDVVNVVLNFSTNPTRGGDALMYLNCVGTGTINQVSIPNSVCRVRTAKGSSIATFGEGEFMYMFTKVRSVNGTNDVLVSVLELEPVVEPTPAE